MGLRIALVSALMTAALACGSADLRVQPWKIGGSVTDANGGRPIAGATVRAYECGEGPCSPVVTAATDEHGRFSLAPIGRNPFVLEATANGYDTRYWDSPAGISLTSASRLTIDRDRFDIDISLQIRR
jgi:hypothetical protein